jgi:hypothetical protein
MTGPCHFWKTPNMLKSGCGKRLINNQRGCVHHRSHKDPQGPANEPPKSQYSRYYPLQETIGILRKIRFKTTINLETNMGVQKKTRKFATVKRIIGQRDARLKKNQTKGEEEAKKKEDGVIREVYVTCSQEIPLTKYMQSTGFIRPLLPV